MAMLWTTIAFFALTACFIWFHLRKSPAATARVAVPAGPPCARCGTALPAGAVFCPGCGLPLQVYDVVLAPVSAGGGGGSGGAAAAKHAHVREDLCVGCGTCVAACPEPGALRLEGSRAVVDQDRCIGHGHCAAACPVGAMVLSSGPAVHSVEVPFLGPDFQTNIAGVYIVGELGGRGLIKNAVNEGKLVIEGIHRQIEGNGGGPEMLDVLIVGSGPAGLSAGLEAQRSGLRYRILEQGSLGDSIRRYPRHKLLLAEPVRVPLYGDLWVADATKEALLKVWETIAANTGLEIRTGHKVENVVRKEGFFALECGNGTIHAARRVVLALGRRGTPRRLQVPGEELPKVLYDVSEMEIFRGRRVLVVGGGESAAESALGLAGQTDTEVTLSYRGNAFQRVGPRNAEKLDAAIRSGRIQLRLQTQVRAIQPERVTLATAGGEVAVPNDDVVVRIGGEPPSSFLERVGVRIVSKDLALPSAGAERRA